MKRKLLALSVLSVGVVASAATQNTQKIDEAKALLSGKVPTPSTHVTTHTHASASANQPATVDLTHPKPPLNQYGAVDVNASVPYAVQVPPKPASLILPKIVSEYDRFPNLVEKPPQLNAKSYLLLDAKTGQVLAADNANMRMPPASITKLMIVYLLEKALDSGKIQMSQKLTVPTVAWATGGSRMFLKPNEKVGLRDLISGMLVDSGNDAAVTIATYLGGTQSAFVGMMNHEAKQIGMTNTHFTDVMGLPAPAHYSSARDLGVLAYHIVHDYPQYLPWFSQKWFTYNGIRQPNFNKLLFIYRYALGLKTGSTKAAGYSLVGLASQGSNRGNALMPITVVLGTASRNQSAQQTKALMQYAFRNFRTVDIYAAGKQVTEAKVLGGEKPLLSVGVAHGVTVTIPSGATSKLHAHAELNRNIKAPIKIGERIGKLVVKCDGRRLTEVPLVALEAMKKGSFFQQLTAKIKSIF